MTPEERAMQKEHLLNQLGDALSVCADATDNARFTLTTMQSSNMHIAQHTVDSLLGLIAIGQQVSTVVDLALVKKLSQDNIDQLVTLLKKAVETLEIKH